MDSLIQTVSEEDWLAKCGLNTWEIALEFGDWHLVRWLLDENVHISSRNLLTLVHHVVSDAETSRLRRSDARLHILRATLRAAAKAGDLGCVKQLMERARAHKWHLTDLANLLCCSAHLAVKRRYTDVAQHLIKHNDVRGDEPSLYNVFEIAVENDLAELQTLLRQKTYFGNVCASAGSNLTFLHLAAQSGSQACFQLLLNCPDMNINAVSSPEGFTPLHVAAYYGHANIVSLLLERVPPSPELNPMMTDLLLERVPPSPELNPMMTDLQGRTALHTAAGQGWLEVVRELLRAAIEVDRRDNDGMTALHLAACAGHTAVVRELVVNSTCRPGLEVQAYTSQMLLLHNVLFTERLSGVAENGVKADLYAKTFSRPSVVRSVFWSLGGFTPLHFAAVYGRQKVVEELILQLDKIDILIEDDAGLTAYEWAEASGIGQVFLEYLDASNKGELKAQLVRRDSFNVERAKSFCIEASRIEHMKKELEWCYEMGKAVSCSEWIAAKGLVSQIPIVKVKIDNAMWQFLAWAFQMARTANGDILQEDKVEKIVLLLLDAEAFSNETLQHCLMWAIRENKVKVAEKLVFSESVNCNKRTPCFTPGASFKFPIEGLNAPLTKAVSEAGSTPLAYASRLRRLKIVEVMERREDVKRALNEERQDYLEYANTMLVAAVLMAGSAYQAAVQPLPPSEFESDHNAVQAFSGYVTIGFLLAMATVIIVATTAMPTRPGKLAGTKMRMLITMSVASVLFLLTILFLTLSFEYITLVNVPGGVEDLNANSSNAGALLVFSMMSWFLCCLFELVTGIGILSLFKRFLLMPFILAFEKCRQSISAYLPRNHRVLRRISDSQDFATDSL